MSNTELTARIKTLKNHIKTLSIEDLKSMKEMFSNNEQDMPWLPRGVAFNLSTYFITNLIRIADRECSAILDLVLIEAKCR